MEEPNLPPSAEQAAEALRDIRKTERRSAERYGDRIASQHLMWWGVVWLIGYSAGIRPSWSGTVWLLLVPIGVAGSIALGVRQKRVARQPKDWRWLAAGVLIGLFLTALFTVLPPGSGAQIGVVIPLLVGFCYTLYGVWQAGMRMVWTGVALDALTVLGYLEFQPHCAIWMAVVGGGGLIVGGLWLRSA